MFIVAIGGSPNQKSRSSELLNYSIDYLEHHGIESYTVTAHDFVAEDLLYANFNSPSIKLLNEKIAKADGIIIATPIYKAAYSGVLKTILDLIAERGLLNKIILPIATAGTHNHFLALDYALRPIITALKAKEILHGIFATDNQIQYATSTQPLLFDPSLKARLIESLNEFIATLHHQKTNTLAIHPLLAEAI
ncbi:NADPH-dependent FMN reductase [Entomomonas moraniae]|uniref:NADPH-dependent FMN reductase n=1 Tax=Entomomonas moraniae TaxID=2213226 RepID=A0A3Q9JK58_9GAMM|nr:NADPH-dependent FMN reductase [Entomomonas moraniae]AZS51490.1 NADPH-dependent FMN reductase [Entomomonas moraniae]